MKNPINIFKKTQFIDVVWNEFIPKINKEGFLVNNEWVELIRAATLENYLFVNVISKLKFDDFDLSIFKKVFDFEFRNSETREKDVNKALSVVENLHLDYFKYSNKKRSELLSATFDSITIDKKDTIRISYKLNLVASKAFNKNK